MFFRLLAAFIVVPLVELYLLLRLADATSVFATFAIVLGTGVLGSILARREGALAWFRFRSALAEGRVPSREIQDGLMVVFAAALLLTPGLLTDTLGFLLLIPAGRNFVRTYVLSRYVSRMNFHVVTPESPVTPEGPVAPNARSAGPDMHSPLEPGAGGAAEQLNRRGYTIDATSFEPRR